jgi:DNA-binding GntR family transcriptional regulator
MDLGDGRVRGVDRVKTRITTVDITTVQERVYRELRGALQQGRLVSGQSMTVRALARAVGTSEMPVREALRRLIAEGALLQAPNRSFQVIPMTKERLAELTRVRVALESMATRLAAGVADAPLIAELTRLNDEMRDAIEPSNADEVLRANQEFHFAIYRAANSPQLLELIDMLWLRSGPYLADVLRSRADAKEIFRRGTVVHARLIRAMAKGDAEAVARALSLDLERTAEYSMKHLASAASRAQRYAA